MLSKVTFCGFSHLLRVPSLLLPVPTTLIAQHLALYTALSALTATSYILNKLGAVLGDRIRDHPYDIHINDLSKPVSCPFNSFNHFIFNFVAFGLSLIKGGNDFFKTQKMRLIHTLVTLIPTG